MTMLEVKKPAHSTENLFEKVYKLNKKITESLNYSKMPRETAEQKNESKEKYWKASKELDGYIQVGCRVSRIFWWIFN